MSWILSRQSEAVLRIRNAYPRSWIWMFHPGSEFFHPGYEFFPSRIRIKEFKYFNPKKLFLSSRKYDPGYSSRILIFTHPGSRDQKGSGSATLIPGFPGSGSEPKCHWFGTLYFTNSEIGRFGTFLCNLANSVAVGSIFIKDFMLLPEASWTMPKVVKSTVARTCIKLRSLLKYPLLSYSALLVYRVGTLKCFRNNTCMMFISGTWFVWFVEQWKKFLKKFRIRYDHFFRSGLIDTGSGSSILDWIPIRIQGFDDQKLGKNYSRKKLCFVI